MGISLVIVKSDTKKVEGINVSPIHLKYSFKGGYKRFPTHQFIEQKYWKNGVISNRHPQYTDLNKRINSVRKKLEDVVTDIIETGGIPTPDLVKINFEKNEETQLTKQPVNRQQKVD